MGRRGLLRVYLGAAPGSGKTFAMLREGRERMAQGEDVLTRWLVLVQKVYCPQHPRRALARVTLNRAAPEPRKM